MAKKADIRTVAGPFSLSGVDYEEGDEFAVPAGWEEIEPIPGQYGVVFERQIGEVREGQQVEPLMGKIVLPLEE